MAYIGNDLQVAYQSYQIIDDISGSFNGSTTSFALLVGGVAPVPFPINEQQCLISVGGVIQEPDPSGTNGFKFSGGNIVFSSAPNSGEDFFGVILAGADYVNVGVNYPSGSESAPSITFDTDLDTGVYNPAANELGFVTNGSDAIRINSSGNVTLSADLTVDTNTLYVDSSNNRVGVGTTSPNSPLDVRGTGSTIISIFTNGTQGIDIATTATGGSVQTSNINQTLDLRTYGTTTNSITFNVGNTERARIDGSGRLLVGTSTARNLGGIGTCQFTLEGTGYNSSSVAFVNNENSVQPSYFILGKSRGGSVGSNTIVQSGDSIGQIVFAGADGTDVDTRAAEILCAVDGTPGANDMPGRLVFSTTPSGSASPTERMVITNDGITLLGKSTTDVDTVGYRLDPSGQSFTSVNSSTSGVNTLHVYSTSANAYRFYLGMDGTVNATNTTISAISDQRFKENIRDLDTGLNEILALQPRRFDWKEGKGKNIQNDQGFIAQEFEQVFPEMVGEWLDPAPEGEEPYKSVRADLIPVLVKAIQEQQTIIQGLEARLSALEAQ